MEMLITDLTYMRGGVCIAGINTEIFENVRPVLSFGQIQLDFVRKNNIYPGAIIRFDFTNRKSTPPHIEDYAFNPANTGFVKFLAQSEWQNILNSCAVSSLASAFNNLIVDNKGILPGAKASSLAVIGVDNVRVNFFDSDANALLPFKARISFISDGISYHLPVTDLQFLDYCNDRFSNGVSRDKLKDDLAGLINDGDYLYLRIGLTRPFKKSEDAKELCYFQINGLYSNNLDNEIRHIAMNERRNVSLNYDPLYAASDKQKVSMSNALQFRLFNIQIANSDKEMEALNAFLCDVEVKKINADVVDNKFWSILLGYVPFASKNTMVKAEKPEKFLCESISELTTEDMDIYERLRKWRKDKAQELNFPEYLVFSNKTLMTMAKIKPVTIDVLLNISGVGEKKVSEYGDEVLRIIKE